MYERKVINIFTLIYDGNNLAYRSNSVMELSTKDGRRTSAIFGVLNSIPKDVKLLHSEHKIDINEVIMVWDCGRNKRRTELYPEYKRNRKHDDTEDDKLWYSQFLEQTNVIHEFVKNLGVKSIKIQGQEADDIVFGLTKMLFSERPDEEGAIIVSTDEDFLQLVSEKIYVYSPIKNILYTPDNFESIFGINLKYFLDYKVLQGDNSDNIGGIQGIGEKTSKKLVTNYGGIPGILENSAELMKSKVTGRIFTPEGLSILDRNNQLINLADFVDTSDIDEALLEIVEEQPSIDDTEVMGFLKNYQLSSLIMKYKEWIRVFKSVNNSYYD